MVELGDVDAAARTLLGLGADSAVEFGTVSCDVVTLEDSEHSADAPAWYSQKTRGGAVVQAGDGLFRQYFRGWDGTQWKTAGYMEVVAATASAGPPSPTDMAGTYRLYLCPAGSVTPTLRMSITSDAPKNQVNIYDSLYAKGNFVTEGTTYIYDEGNTGYPLHMIRPSNVLLDTISVDWSLKNAAATPQSLTYGVSGLTLEDNTDGSEDGSFFWDVMKNGTSTNALTLNADVATMTGALNVGAGSAAAPSIYMNGDSDTGFYYAAPNMIGVSIGGKEQEIFRSDNNNAATQHYDSEANAGGYQSIFRKHRATAIVQNNDLIGSMIAQGYDGAAFRNSSYIGMFVGGTPGTSDMPGTVIIGVSADGSDYMAERFRIASTGYITSLGVYDQTSGSAANVYVDSSGNLCRSTSSECYKNDIEAVPAVDTAKVLQLQAKQFEAIADTEREARNKVMNLQLAEKYYTWALESGREGDVSKAIAQLEKAQRKAAEETIPVTQYGLIAQEVEQILPKLVTYDENGEADAVAYDRVAVLLLEEVKTLKGQVDGQQKTIEDLVKRLEKLEKP
jgi:hypothetical protein